MALHKLISKIPDRFGSKNEARSAIGAFLTEQFPECVVEHRMGSIRVIRGRDIFCGITIQKKGNVLRCFGAVRKPWWTHLVGPLISAIHQGAHRSTFEALRNEVTAAFVSEFSYRGPETFWEKIS